MSDGIAGAQHYAGDAPWVPAAPERANTWPFKSETDLRAFVATEVARQLPDAIRKALEDDAREISANRAFQPVAVEHTPSGICWACGEYGKAEEMMWYGAHLVHSTVECARGAQVKPESKEHRG